MACYDGAAGTEGVGPCKGGTMTCESEGTWSPCNGEVLPVPEICGNGIDDDCNGVVDDDVDADGDGWTSCGGDCCDNPNLCGNPAAVNPGAFEVAGDGVDNDCDGHVDNPLPLCDSGMTSNSTTPMDYAKAMDLCQTSGSGSPPKNAMGPKWGVISAGWSYANGTGTPGANGHSIRPHYGTGTMPQVGGSLVEISTGHAAAQDDGSAAPSYEDLESGTGNGGSSPFPSDWFTANNSKLPNAPGCPAPDGNTANDPTMLTLSIRVPTNAESFSLKTNFFSSEFPEYVCSPYNDFFVVLLDSTYTGSGSAANPADKNLAFYQDPAGMKYPVGVNLAANNTGLFTQCVNGTLGCDASGGGSISSCTGTTELAGTGLDTAEPGECDSNSLEGGGTGWLTTTGNVVPGEIITVRIAIWNTSDDALQSLAVIDGFTWSTESSNPGTTINIARPGGGVLSKQVEQVDLRHLVQ